MPCTPWIGNGGCIKMYVSSRASFFDHGCWQGERTQTTAVPPSDSETTFPFEAGFQGFERQSTIQRARVSMGGHGEEMMWHCFFFKNFSQQVPDCWPKYCSLNDIHNWMESDGFGATWSTGRSSLAVGAHVPPSGGAGWNPGHCTVVSDTGKTAGISRVQ